MEFTGLRNLMVLFESTSTKSPSMPGCSSSHHLSACVRVPPEPVGTYQEPSTAPVSTLFVASPSSMKTLIVLPSMIWASTVSGQALKK